MSDPTLLDRQLERYRKLLYGATDPMLIEGLRKLIAELEVQRAQRLARADAPSAAGEQPDLFDRGDAAS